MVTCGIASQLLQELQIINRHLCDIYPVPVKMNWRQKVKMTLTVHIKKHQCAVSSLRLDFLKLQPQTWGVYFCFLKHCSLEFFTHVFMCYLHFQVWHCALLYYSTESFKSLKLRCGHQFTGLDPIFVPPQCSVSHLPANQDQDCLSPCLFSSFLYRARLSQAYRQLSFHITLICFLM